MLTTDRLLLRRWRDADRASFAAMNADPVVMEHFPSTRTRAESDALVDRIEAGFEAHGFGLWAVERREDGELLGFVGLSRPSVDVVVSGRALSDEVEIGWRLRRDAWGQGYAAEAAREVLRVARSGTDTGGLGLESVVSFTAEGNLRSRALMERLGMTRDPADDFEHPALPVGHPQRAHVLYRLTLGRPAPSVAIEQPAGDDVLSLLRQADEYALSLYPAENYHVLDVESLRRPDVSFFVARHEGTAVGTAAIVDRGDGSGELKRVFVADAARGLGVGRALLAAVEQHARGLGIGLVQLETGLPQVAAVILYEKTGYVPIPAFGPYVGDETSWCMEKRL
ncbi:RimJ/RimL family protein N-acetyltransferase [Frigoribacterium sp. PhB160]|uniref:GNAT family N-acetyltransferase n=1 Tax=Frigoribacterium sp. PhB160 TaxID=2485192 RepID=UPI000F47D07B|nr:GNAT family N-acetyltransferase [Frigoribacterium sp. PhB160]ROS59635.1 RimJ/RimL family protein N-acetyltransferase [Frigoribacterium sp. PhB160]